MYSIESSPCKVSSQSLPYPGRMNVMLTTHPDSAALLRTICERPDDDFARLVFADWLEEGGETERSEFIRVQIELAKLPDVPILRAMPAITELMPSPYGLPSSLFGLPISKDVADLLDNLDARCEALRRREHELEWQTAFWGADLPLPAVPRSGQHRGNASHHGSGPRPLQCHSSHASRQHTARRSARWRSSMSGCPAPHSSAGHAANPSRASDCSAASRVWQDGAASRTVRNRGRGSMIYRASSTSASWRTNPRKPR